MGQSSTKYKSVSQDPVTEEATKCGEKAVTDELEDPEFIQWKKQLEKNNPNLTIDTDSF